MIGCHNDFQNGFIWFDFDLVIIILYSFSNCSLFYISNWILNFFEIFINFII